MGIVMVVGVGGVLAIAATGGWVPVLLMSAAMALGLFLGWLVGPVSDELRAFRMRGGYFGDQTEWTLARRWVAYWYGRNKA